MSAVDRLLLSARANLDRVPPENLANEIEAGAILVDIRPTEQRARDGDMPRALVIDRNVLEWRMDITGAHHIAEITDQNQRIILVCNEGYASSLAAATLRALGLSRATDLVGGFQAWASDRAR